MNVLVTAGNTLVPIDKVRCITNLFTGRTGAGIALHAHDRSHAVTLLTSHPDTVADLRAHGAPADERWQVFRYRTFDELHERMAELVRGGGFDVVVHSAAVSDYRAAGIYAPAAGTRFDPDTRTWDGGGKAPVLADRAAGKVKSDEQELWLRLVRTPKIVDRIRADWGFGGVLVKFKLEVEVEEAELLKVAERSRLHSGADLMAANTLTGMHDWAFVGPLAEGYQRVARRDLAARLLDAVERLHEEKAHG